MGLIKGINTFGLHTNAVGFFGVRGKNVQDWIDAGATAEVFSERKGMFKTVYRVNINGKDGRQIISGTTDKQHNADRFVRLFNDRAREATSGDGE